MISRNLLPGRLFEAIRVTDFMKSLVVVCGVLAIAVVVVVVAVVRVSLKLMLLWMLLLLSVSSSL